MKIKIHCFEGEWYTEKPELSVRPLVQVVEQLNSLVGNSIDYSYKFCQNINRLSTNLVQLDGRKMARGEARNCFYFAFHGNGRGLSDADENFLSFEEIAKLIKPKATNSIILFGSCGTHASADEFKEFKDITGAALVAGYTKTVNWLPSSLFEMLFFSELCRYKHLTNFKNKMHKYIRPDQQLFAGLGVQLV